MLNFQNLIFRSCDLYFHMIMLVVTEFRVNRAINRRDIAKNDFQYGVLPPSWICFAVIILYQKTAFYVPNFVLTFHDVRLRIFGNTLYFTFQHFGLKLPISGLILTIFGEIDKNVKIKYSNPQKAHPWRKTRLLSIDW